MNPRLILLSAAGSALVLARWAVQGARGVWTNLDKSLYVPDPDLGWRRIDSGIVWLGLDALALCVGLTLMLGVVAWATRKRDSQHALANKFALALGVLSLVPGTLAFASGGVPEGAVDHAPTGVHEAPEGVTGGLPGLPAGAWSLANVESNAVVATLSAGGEEFEARFSEFTRASLRADLADLSQSLSLELAVNSASVDTGIDGRSSHARKLLEAETHAEIEFRLTQLIGAKTLDADHAEVAARAEVKFMGQTLSVESSGEIKRLDAQARKRLGIAAEHALRVQAGFGLTFADTALAPHEKDFDKPELSIRANLIFVPAK